MTATTKLVKAAEYIAGQVQEYQKDMGDFCRLEDDKIVFDFERREKASRKWEHKWGWNFKKPRYFIVASGRQNRPERRAMLFDVGNYKVENGAMTLTYKPNIPKMPQDIVKTDESETFPVPRIPLSPNHDGSVEAGITWLGDEKEKARKVLMFGGFDGVMFTASYLFDEGLDLDKAEEVVHAYLGQ